MTRRKHGISMKSLRDIVSDGYDRWFRLPVFRTHRTLILYFVFGCMASATDLLVYLVLFNAAHFPAVVSTVVSISAATVVGFALNAKINYRVTDRLALRFLSYASVSGVGMAISSAMLYVLHDLGDWDGNLVKILSLPIVFVVQYALNSLVSFRTAAVSKTAGK